MSHHISAFILKGPFDKRKADEFRLRAIALPCDLTLFPLSTAYVDELGEELGIDGYPLDFPLLTSPLLHHVLESLAPDPLFAVIETNYFGGVGGQSAAAYRGREELMAFEAAGFGPINKALRLLGVSAAEGLDEFDTVGLGRFRSF